MGASDLHLPSADRTPAAVFPGGCRHCLLGGAASERRRLPRARVGGRRLHCGPDKDTLGRGSRTGLAMPQVPGACPPRL